MKNTFLFLSVSLVFLLTCCDGQKVYLPIGGCACVQPGIEPTVYSSWENTSSFGGSSADHVDDSSFD